MAICFRISISVFRCLVCPWVFVGFVVTTASAADDNELLEFFEKKIRPVLVENCYECHSSKSDEVKGNLLVDTQAGLLEGGGTGAAVVPGNTEESLILTALSYEEDAFQMPPNGKLSDEVLNDFKKWIEDGAVDPRKDDRVDPRKLKAADHWSFQPPRSRDVPIPFFSRVDGWIGGQMRDRSIEPAPLASRDSMISRVYYDLIGLPPGYEEVTEFRNNQTPLAYQRLVERLLSSPRFGERWGRMWLDVARYSDTKGYLFTEDRSYTHAYTYREWVIGAWNFDLPYDQFIKYQLAADQLPPLPFGADARAAMGFLTLGRRFLNNRHDIIDDRIDVTMRGMMGLTVTCARCHDHKYDAIPTADYYSLYGVFLNSNEPKNEPAPLRLEDAKRIRESFIFVRGHPEILGPQVPRRFLSVIRDDAPPFKTGSGRAEMAEAIANVTNPLTARVFVNRVWMRLFGSPLVATPSDFGARCEQPLQRDLLDDLSVRFMERDWSLKGLVREIVLSETYRRSTNVTASASFDTENRYVSHQNIRRRDFEGTWDAMLACTNDLDFTIGGPSVKLHEKPFPKRRGVYAHIDRQNLPGMFRTFDLASPDAHAPRRYETTSPQQALFLMNSLFLMERCRHLARRSNSHGDQERIGELYRTVLSRDPDDEERAACLEFLRIEQMADRQGVRLHRWSYGYGPFDESAGRVTRYTELSHFTGTTWQGGEKSPDAALGYVSWHKSGGHPGTKDAAAVRRLYFPRETTIRLRGRFAHDANEGDGVRLTIHCQQNGTLGTWTARHSVARFTTRPVSVPAGGSIDLIVDMRDSNSFDSFQLVFQAVEEFQNTEHTINSVTTFAGPPPPPLDPWAKLAQVLLLSNEFLFID
jgi:hypothetical protein